MATFQSTRPARGATKDNRLPSRPRQVSIHAPRAGRDSMIFALKVPSGGFNPRAPRGARHGCGSSCSGGIQFQSTRPARGATIGGRFGRRRYWVSIHAPRAGRDSPYWDKPRKVKGFNPRAPRGARRARHVHPAPSAPCFNPRAPRGARQKHRPAILSAEKFQSTRPARGATCGSGVGTRHLPVSIHAPRAGRDECRELPEQQQQRFQSTRPARGATTTAGVCGAAFGVSIHAPRAGRDRRRLPKMAGERRFNPRAPRGARHALTLFIWWLRNVSIHAPRAGRDNRGEVSDTRHKMFQSTRPARGATRASQTT